MAILSEIQLSHPLSKYKHDVIALLDTGNSFHSLISPDIINKYKIDYLPVSKTAFSIDLSEVKIIGQVELQFNFNKSPKVFKETFFIPQAMSDVINFGAKFLQENKINILLEKNAIQIENHTIPLYDMPNKQNFNPCNISKIKVNETQTRDLPGLKYNTHKFCKYLEGPKVNLCLNETTCVFPGTKVIKVRVPKYSGLQNKEIYITPLESKRTSRQGFLLIEGAYQMDKDNSCYVNCVNFSDRKLVIKANTLLGHGQTLSSDVLDDTINQLNISALDKDTLIQRSEFISEALNLDSNPIFKEDDDLKFQVLNLCLKYYHVFSVHDNEVGNTNLIEFNIKLKEGAEPKKGRVIPLNPEYRKKLKEQIDKWLESNIIREDFSPWASPIFPVKKKPSKPGGEAKLRFVVDYRYLNNCSEKLAWPLPLISDNIQRLGTGRIFSILDLTQAYHAIKIDKESQPYTAFIADNRQFVFERLPFGLSNAPAYFCRLMSRVLAILPEMYTYVIAYLDDLIIYSLDNTLHLKHIENTLRVLQMAGLKVNLSKCQLFSDKCKYLGHVISREGIEVDTEYLDRIKHWSRPVSGKDLQRFLGFTNYYRDYYPQYAKISHPLDDHRNDDKIDWTPELVKTWEMFKDMFTQAVQKGYPDWDSPNPFIFDIDFSSHYFAGIISQQQNNQEKIIGICTKKCNATEQKYASHKGEMACLIFVIKTFLHLARYREFLVRTDSSSLVNYKTWTKNSVNGVSYRWLVFLQSFSFKIIHRKGKEHVNVDCLSRAKFDCSKHSLSECQSCVDNNTLDPYYDNCLFEDQIFALCNYEIVPDLKHWLIEIQKDEATSQLRDWVVQNHVLTKEEKAELGGRLKYLSQFLDHVYVVKGILIFRQPKHTDRPIVPLGLYNNIFDLAHSAPGMGHRGVTETVAKINDKYFMPGLQKFVEARIHNCLTCLKKIGHSPKHKHPIEHSASATRVFEYVSIDLIGPLSPAKYKGQTVRYIFMLVCLFSRFIFSYPMVDATTESTIDIICNEFFTTFGLFRKVRSDRGSNFTSKVFQGVIDRLGIKAVVTPARNPNSNPIERQNQSIYSALRSNNDFDIIDWPQKLATATLIINCSKSRRTGFTPYYIVYGRQPILPIDIFAPITKTTEEINCYSYIKFVQNIESIIKHISTKKQLYIEFENKFRTDKEEIYIHDVVFAFFNLVRVGISKKLQSFYCGPFLVVKKFSKVLFEISPVHNCPVKNNQVISRDKLRKISTSTMVFGEKISFEIYPLSGIVPSEDITLKISNNNEDNITQDISFKDTTFSYLNDSNDAPIPENIYTDELKEEGGFGTPHISEENTPQIFNQTLPEGGDLNEEDIEYGTTDIDIDKQKDAESEKHILSEFDSSVQNQNQFSTFENINIPSERFFMPTKPTQSSPKKVILVDERQTLPEYFYDKVIRTRSKNKADPHPQLSLGTKKNMSKNSSN